jgi:hypothetical protein
MLPKGSRLKPGSFSRLLASGEMLVTKPPHQRAITSCTDSSGEEVPWKEPSVLLLPVVDDKASSADRRKLPIFTFVNKLDRPALEPLEIIDQLEREFGLATYPMNWPIGSGDRFAGIFDRVSRNVILFGKKVSEVPGRFFCWVFSHREATRDAGSRLWLVVPRRAQTDGRFRRTTQS